MHDNKYKVVIYGKNVYKEYILNAAEKKTVKIGTSKNCDVRFNKDAFFEEFELVLEYFSDTWQLSSCDNIYFTANGIIKSVSKDLEHGDVLTFKYKSSNAELFKLNFFVDFDSVKRNYNRVIDISSITSIKIGGQEDSDIFIVDNLLNKDTITLTKKDNEIYVRDNNTRYGIYINGERIVKQKEIKLNDCDFFMIAGYSFYLKEGRLYTDTNDAIKIRNLEFHDIKEQKSAFKYPKFNLSTRKKYVLPQKEIEILSPKAKPNPQKTNLFLLIMPSLALLALTVVLRGVIGGGGSFVIYSAASMGITVLASIAGYIFKEKEYKKELKKREKDYLEYIKNKEVEITAVRKEELKILQKKYRSIDENIEAVFAFDSNLFDRDMNDDDFLAVRVGTGSIPANCEIKYKPLDFHDKEDDLAGMPEMIAMRYRNIINAPIVSEFAKSGGIGVVGNHGKLYEFLKNITVEIATRHFYKDVKLIYIYDSKYIEKFMWIRWLKHVVNDEINVRNFVYDDESSSVILEYIYAILSQREQAVNEKSKRDFYPYFVVFVFDSNIIKKHPISKYIENSKLYGFTFVFFEKETELLPKGCTEIITLSDDKYIGEIFKSANSAEVIRFEYEPVTDSVAEEVALRISPVYVDEVSLESDLTKNISLFELLDIMSVEDLDIAARWGSSRVDKSMAAPLGVKVKNEVVYLDLHEKHHGPHGLVAGTTGSGKSEILQTFVLSMATLYHPYEVGFVIIDFKGGGMVNQFQNLPHLMGSITNIDGREINRSLKSIKAELQKRQELFSANKVNHIDDYIKLYKKDNSIVPLPHLIIIVDEFAELKTEHPEFMKELISAARIGRSLGVHLILATQKPSGVVDSQIWSNSKFRLCLKVQTKEDSMEVLKSPLAAEIVEPGRAYLQVGNNEIFDLFQSAYSGAKVIEGNEPNQNIFEIYQLNLWGKRQVVYSNKKSVNPEGAKTQLQAIVEYLDKYCKENNITRLRGICLPPMKDVIYLDELKPTLKNVVEGIFVTTGLYDDPEQQLQSELVINLSESNTYIIGSSQTGKTTLLQTMLKDIVATYTPKEVNVYIIDCGNMSLKVFEESRLVGGVAIPNEDEKIDNLIKMLKDEINKRKNVFAQNMVGTYRAYVEAGFRDMPQILLFIDNVNAFREYYPGYDNDLLILSRDGQSAGINIIATATQTNAISYKVLSNFGIRVALNCNDKGEYSNLFDRCRIEPKEVPGRGLFSIDKRIVEFQTALCVAGDKEIERTEKLKEIIQKMNNTYGAAKARPIPQVPDIIKGSVLFNENRTLYSEKYRIPIGMSYDTVDYVYLDLSSIEMFAVIGRNKSGKTNFINHIMTTIQRTIFNNFTEAYIIDSAGRQLERVKKYGFVKEYTVDASDSERIIDTILYELEGRQEYLLENRGVKTEKELLDKYPFILLIIENDGFISEMSRNKEAYAKFIKIIKQYKGLKVCVIFSNIENSNVAYSAPDILKQIKENKKAIIFDDVANIKFFDVNIKYQKAFAKPITLGDGYLYIGGEMEKIKTVLDI
ncbi:MAG TPA: type VII secretion protein EssC [Clostridiaceae bacterium]|nr:type VII secretion protein EssC [Clostridiaceae bacterium]